MAFVHLHNHTVYSMLDARRASATWSSARSILACPPWQSPITATCTASPELGLACDAINHGTPEYKVWSKDKSFLEKGRRDELECPDSEKRPARVRAAYEGPRDVGRPGQHR